MPTLTVSSPSRPTYQLYAKIGVLRRLKRLVPTDVALTLYKTSILPHLLLRINVTLANKLTTLQIIMH